MKRKTFLTALMLTIFAVSAVPTLVTAQKYVISDASTMTIYGSANVTDWEAKVKTISGEVVLRNSENANWADADASWFEEVRITMPVGDIDADSRRMNNNMHDYLKKSNHPNITYELKEGKSLALDGNPDATLTAIGVVTAAGVSHEIEHEVKISKSENGDLVISGSKDLEMSDFNIDPPTAMLGSVRARNEMTIEFELILVKE